MQQDYTIYVVLDAVVAVGSPVFFGFMVFKHRTASRWIRCVFLLLAMVGVPWGILGVLRLGFPTHFTRVSRANFDHYGTLLGGFALGLLTSLLLSPEFWQIAKPRSNRSNQTLQPTAGRSDD